MSKKSIKSTVEKVKLEFVWLTILISEIIENRIISSCILKDGTTNGFMKCMITINYTQSLGWFTKLLCMIKLDNKLDEDVVWNAVIFLPECLSQCCRGRGIFVRPSTGCQTSFGEERGTLFMRLLPQNLIQSCRRGRGIFVHLPLNITGLRRGRRKGILGMSLLPRSLPQFRRRWGWDYRLPLSYRLFDFVLQGRGSHCVWLSFHEACHNVVVVEEGIIVCLCQIGCQPILPNVAWNLAIFPPIDDFIVKKGPSHG